MLKIMQSLVSAFRTNPYPTNANGQAPARVPVSSWVPPMASVSGNGDGAIPTSDTDMQDALRRIFTRRDPAQAGSIHLVGLESLRSRLGARWASVSDRVHMLTIRLLSQYLSPQDTWFRHEGDVYVVVFAKLGPLEARLICGKVVEELQNLLLGVADASTIMVRTVVHEIGSDVMFVPANLKQMLDAAAASLGHRTGQDVDNAVDVHLHAAEPVAPLEVRYRPVWDVKQQVISVFIARACRPRRGRAPLWGLDCLADPADAQQVLEMDMMVIRESVETAAELYDNRFRFFLSVPIHFESLAVQSRRRALLAVLQAIPTHMRPFMTYHLYGTPVGVPVSRLGEMISTLRPYGRTTMVVVDPATADMTVLAAAGAKVACVLLPPGMSAERCRADLLRFGAAAAKNRLHSSVEGVDSLALESLCEDANISFLSGDLVGDWSFVPEHAVRRSLSDFCRHMEQGQLVVA